jgi:hypothetical protein
MESRCCSGMKFEYNSHIHCNSPAHTILHPVPMRLITIPKSPSTVWEFAVGRWLRSGGYGIIWHKVDIPSVFLLVSTGVQVIVGEFHNSWTSLQLQALSLPGLIQRLI